MPCLLFPHISWWKAAIRSQSTLTLYVGRPLRNIGYRNRYRIAAANGALLLSVPVKGGRRLSAPVKDTAIDYTHSWQRQHWRSLFSAYGRAPFFEHYGGELERLLFSGHKWLLDLNMNAIELLNQAMQLKMGIVVTDQLPKEAEDAYWRAARPGAASSGAAYHQVFEDRLGFLPDLSAIDLLMAEGPYAAACILNS
jgi:hypothetical protein